MVDKPDATSSVAFIVSPIGLITVQVKVALLLLGEGSNQGFILRVRQNVWPSSSKRFIYGN